MGGDGGGTCCWMRNGGIERSDTNDLEQDSRRGILDLCQLSLLNISLTICREKTWMLKGYQGLQNKLTTDCMMTYVALDS